MDLEDPTLNNFLGCEQDLHEFVKSSSEDFVRATLDQLNSVKDSKP